MGLEALLDESLVLGAQRALGDPSSTQLLMGCFCPIALGERHVVVQLLPLPALPSCLYAVQLTNSDRFCPIALGE